VAGGGRAAAQQACWMAPRWVHGAEASWAIWPVGGQQPHGPVDDSLVGQWLAGLWAAAWWACGMETWQGGNPAGFRFRERSGQGPGSGPPVGWGLGEPAGQRPSRQWPSCSFSKSLHGKAFHKLRVQGDEILALPSALL
jgi:hypothetical protein